MKTTIDETSKIDHIITLDSATYTVAYALDSKLTIRNLVDNNPPQYI